MVITILQKEYDVHSIVSFSIYSDKNMINCRVVTKLCNGNFRVDNMGAENTEKNEAELNLIFGRFSAFVTGHYEVYEKTICIPHSDVLEKREITENVINMEVHRRK